MKKFNPLIWGLFGMFAVVVISITLINVFSHKPPKTKMVMSKALAFPQARMSHADSVKWDSIKAMAKMKADEHRVNHVRGASREQAIKMAQLFLRQRMPYAITYEDKPTISESKAGFHISQQFSSPDDEGMLTHYKYKMTVIYGGGGDRIVRNWTYRDMLIHNKLTGGDYAFNTPYGLQ